jgi:hypothetical protein
MFSDKTGFGLHFLENFVTLDDIGGGAFSAFHFAQNKFAPLLHRLPVG